MALTISTGFVVDDAIVVIENITRYLEQGMQPFAGRAQGRQGDRLHGADHEHLADRRVHSAAADGRHRGPPVPRVRGHAVGGHRGLAGGFAHHHAHDVRAPAAGAPGARLALPRQRTGLQRGSSMPTGRTLSVVLRIRADHAGDPAGDDRPERVSVHPCAQGILPAAGQRAHDGRHSWRIRTPRFRPWTRSCCRW